MLYNFWRTPAEFTISDKLRAKIGVWLLSKKLIVFNLQYECGASLNYFGVYIRDVLDVMMLNRCLGRSGSLKEVASLRLGVQIWNSEVDEWNDIILKIIKNMKPTHKGRIRDEVSYLQDGKCRSIDDLIKWFDSVEKVTNRVSDCREAFYQMNKLVKKYYSSQRYIDFCRRFFDLVIQRSTIKDLECRFTDIPIEIIAPYAIADVEYTSQVKDKLEAEVKELDIVRISEVYNNLGKLGFELESSGIAWDDELATKLDKVYMDKAIDSLRSLLMTPKFQKILPSKSLSTENNLVFLRDSSQDILEIQTTTNLNDLTKYFNPRSNHKDTRQRFSDLIQTGRLKFLMLLADVFKEYQNDKERSLKNYPVLTPLLEDIIKEPDARERLKVIDMMVDNIEKVNQKITNHPANKQSLWKDDDGRNIPPPEVEKVIKFNNWKLEGMASELIEEVYNALSHIGGIDVNDEETWVPEFRSVFLFRFFKKVIKSYSTYIWGKVGRNRIALVDRSEVHNLRVLRYPGWRERTPIDKIWIKETEFGVATAVTKRFQSGDHTVPASELIDLRISRFPDGVRIHYDLSQSEIRVLATVAHDDNLLQKFIENADIHLFIASKIFDKPEKEISKQERRSAKSAVFAVLYGDSPPSFAAKFLSGNMKLAEYIFNQLFSSFPNIEKWIKQQHRFGLENGYILTPLGDPIYDIGLPPEVLSLKSWQKEHLLHDAFSNKVKLSPNKDRDKELRKLVAKAFRNMQNYPIQNCSSTLAGLGGYYLSKYIRDEELSARVDCFTHDSSDIDCQIFDLPKVFSALSKCVVDKVVEEFKIPIKAEYEIGLSGDQMVGLKNFIADGPVICTGFHETKRTALDLLDDRLSCYGVKTEIVIDSDVEIVQSLGGLFITKGAYSLGLGKSHKLVSGKMKLNFENVRR
jgi:hypothetical protein